MNPWKVILATLVIFGAGVITGGLLVGYSDRALHVSMRKQQPSANPRPAAEPINPMGVRQNPIPPPMPVPLRRDFLDRLERELNLTADQRTRIEKIISDGQDRTREVWQTVEPDMRRELVATRDKIRNELTFDQRPRFEEILRRPQRRPDDPSTNRPLRDLRRGMPLRDVPSDLRPQQ